MRRVVATVVLILGVINSGSEGKLVVTVHPQRQSVLANTTVTIKCSAIADEELTGNLKIEWLKNGEFMENQKAKRASSSSLEFNQASVDDSGSYTCWVTVKELHGSSATASLLVRDRPDPPTQVEIDCQSRFAKLQWVPGPSNNQPIIVYVIYQNTSLDDPGRFQEVGRSRVAHHRMGLRPWGNYSFHVKAVNGLGYSDASAFSTVCTTPEARPFGNPEYTCTATDAEPDQLVITWKYMKQRYHNGEGFHYIVSYRRFDDPGGSTKQIRVDDWRVERIVIDDVPPFTEYEISVRAANNMGLSYREPIRRKGHSGEDRPLVKPTGFAVDTIGSFHAQFSWDAVDEDPNLIRGFFRGYQVRFWKTEVPDDVRMVDVILNPWDPCPLLAITGQRRDAPGDRVTAHVDDLWPNARITAGVLVLNGDKSGELSDTIEFLTAEN